MEDMAGSKVALGCVSKCSAGRLAPPPGKPPKNRALTGQLSHRTPVGQLFTLGAPVKSRNCPAGVLWDNFFGLPNLYGRMVRAVDARSPAEQDDLARGTCRARYIGTWPHSGMRGAAEVCRGSSAPIDRPATRIPASPTHAPRFQA